MRSKRVSHLLGAGLVATAVGLFAGCGDGESGKSCGPGTTDQGGTCVPAAGGASGGQAGAAGAGGTASSGGNVGGNAGAAEVGGAAGDGGSGVGGSSGAAGAAPACPSLPGPTMVAVSTSSGASYCIDSTEVSAGQYRVFAKQKGADMSGQPAFCDWNEEYVSWKQGGSCEPPQDDQPAYCVDWCDAYMYCQWAGKHLCGRVGGGPLTADDEVVTDRREWYNACSAQGALAYPYGNSYDPTKCKTKDYGGVHGSIPVGSASGCHGAEAPYNSIFDMSGNVAEWIDHCIDWNCELALSSWASSEGACDHQSFEVRSYHLESIGFRCCADVVQ